MTVYSNGVRQDPVARLGLLKMDFLGLRTLTVIDDTLQTLARDGIQVDLATIEVAGTKDSEQFL